MTARRDTAVELTVVSRSDAAMGVAVIEFAAASGRELPRWQPGAHIDLMLPTGDVRQYSLNGEPGAATWRIGVLREAGGRGGSVWVHDNLIVGATVHVAGPRNHFEFSPDKGTRYLFIAGGIGITPIAAMARAAAKAGVEYRIEYAGRSRSSMALLDELVDAHGEVVEEAGVLVLSSCKEGTCGTCETRVMDGEIDHRDSILTPLEQAANDVMYICVSRSAGPKLTLEL